MSKLSKIKSEIGNWAQSYHGSQNKCYCGWMDLHKDEPYGKYNKGIWSLRVIDIDPDAVFVHRVGGVFVTEELSPEQVIQFRYDRWHGLLPRDIAKQLEGKRYWKNCKPYIEWLKETLPETFNHSCSTKQDKARFLWEFLI
jgi:hypothetical protein